MTSLFIVQISARAVETSHFIPGSFPGGGRCCSPSPQAPAHSLSSPPFPSPPPSVLFLLSLLAPLPLSSLSSPIASSLTSIFPPQFLSLFLGGTLYLVGCHSGGTTAAKSIQVVRSDLDPRVPSSQAVPGMNSEVQENKIRFLMRGPVVEFLPNPNSTPS